MYVCTYVHTYVCVYTFHLHIYVHMLEDEDEVEDIALITDEPIEDDSMALYFCSPKITANCECYCMYMLVDINYVPLHIN